MSVVMGGLVADMSDADVLAAAHDHLVTAHRWFVTLQARYPEEGAVWNTISVPMTCLALAMEFDLDTLDRVKKRAIR